MQSKDVESQVLIWRSFVKVRKVNGVSMPQFRRFMANSVQANLNVFHIVFNQLGDLSQPLHNKVRTCLFIGFNPRKFTSIGLFKYHIYEQNAWKFATPRIPKLLMKQIQILKLSGIGSIHLE
jgi:hypothetical protein